MLSVTRESHWRRKVQTPCRDYPVPEHSLTADHDNPVERCQLCNGEAQMRAAPPRLPEWSVSPRTDLRRPATVARLRPIVIALASFLSFSVPAAAQGPLLTRDANAPPRSNGAYVHDGFYLRISGGFSVYDERLVSESAALGGKVEARNRGIVSSSDVALGGTISPGWVLGGGIFSVDLIASTLRTRADNAALIPKELDPGLRDLVLIGPFVDYYPDPRAGFHAQAALGLSFLTPRVFGDAATQRSQYLAIGGGLLFGTGYDWWVSEEWSIGVLGQIGLHVLGGKDDNGVQWTHVVAVSPSLSLAVTYH